MRWQGWWVVACLAVGTPSVVGCDSIAGAISEPTPDTAHPKTHTSGLMSFKYPGNWTAKEESHREPLGPMLRSVNLESKGGAVAIVQNLEPAVPIKIEEYGDAFIDGFQKEVGKVSKGFAKANIKSRTPLSDKILGETVEGERIAVTLQLLGQSTPSVVEVRKLERKDGVLIIVTLTPTEDEAKVRSGFELIRSSMSYSTPRVGL